MSDSTILRLFTSLEQTIHERLSVIQQVVHAAQPAPYNTFPGMNTTYAPSQDALLQRIQALEASNQALLATIVNIKNEITALRSSAPNVILPLHPIDGIEVIPKREVVVPETEPLSVADRLLLNRTARKALEAEEMGETFKADAMDVDGSVVEESVADLEVAGSVAEEDEDDEEDEDEEDEEAEEAEEAEAEELEEFDYKGSTYYRDSENKVFMTDEDGELVDEPIGLWSPTKQKIVMIKT